MKELNKSEISSVSGGILPLIVAALEVGAVISGGPSQLIWHTKGGLLNQIMPKHGFGMFQEDKMKYFNYTMLTLAIFCLTGWIFGLYSKFYLNDLSFFSGINFTFFMIATPIYSIAVLIKFIKLTLKEK